ncbi:MAG TPA: isoprenylcysteine carboxylmethyltransferase family protein [Ktedonobacteraceae bacterium]|nr:isoprenylcysteine carboxylmethyltransferase family protein [Ktedonobacteraceae bacterium]
MKSQLSDRSRVRIPPPLIFIGAFVASRFLQSRMPVPLLPNKGRTRLGLVLIGGASTIATFAARTLRRAGTDISPMRPTTTLVVEGPYRFTRNPLYLALTLFYAGLTVLANTFWGALLLPVVLVLVNRGVIEREERYLERKFGEQYMQYKERVRRWL